MAQVIMPGRRQDGALDAIMKGLGIANSIYNIRANAANLEKFQREQEQSNAEQERIASGKLTPREQLAAAEKFDLSRTKTEGAIELKDAQGSPIYATVRKQSAKPVEIRKIVNGKEVVEFVEPKVGMSIPTGKVAESSKPKLGTFETIDENGNRVTKVLPIVAGMSLPKPPPFRDEKKETDKKIKSLGDDTQSFYQTFIAIDGVEKSIGKDFTLDEYEPDTNSFGGKPLDIPGVSIPGLGRVTAGSSDARMLATRIAKIFNKELKDRSGAAVTSTELERVRDEFAAGNLNTEQELLKALRDYKKEARRLLVNIEARYDPNIVKAYRERGGFTSVDTQVANITPDEALEELKRRGLTAGQ